MKWAVSVCCYRAALHPFLTFSATKFHEQLCVKDDHYEHFVNKTSGMSTDSLYDYSTWVQVYRCLVLW